MPPGLGEILAESGDLTLGRLRRASEWRRVHGGTIDRALLATGAVGEETLLHALSRLTGLPAVTRERLAGASREAVGTLPEVTRRRLRALPFERRGDVLLVAVVDPGNPVLETGLVASTGCAVRLHITAEPILEDVLRAWETPPDDSCVSPAGPDPALTRPAPFPEPVLRPTEPDPFARLARAFLVDAFDGGAEAVEIGPERKGGVVRTYAGGLALSARPVPRSVLEPLLAWFLARSRPSGPFDEGGLVLERSRRRVRVNVTVDRGGIGWLVLAPEPVPTLPAGETEICLHEAAEGDVFCLSCGSPL